MVVLEQIQRELFCDGAKVARIMVPMGRGPGSSRI